MERAFRFVVVAAIVLVTALFFVGCLSISESNSLTGGIPEPIYEARRNQENAFVGIGVARLETISLSKAAAVEMAFVDILRQLEVIIENNTVTTYSPGNETDAELTIYKSQVQRTSAQRTIRGAEIIEEYLSPDGEYWVAMILSWSAARTQIERERRDTLNRLNPSVSSDWAIEIINEFFNQSEDD